MSNESNWLDSMTGKPSGAVEISITGRKESIPQTFTEAIGDAMPVFHSNVIESRRIFSVKTAIDVLGAPQGDIKQVIYCAKHIESYLLTGEMEESKEPAKAVKNKPKEE